MQPHEKTNENETAANARTLRPMRRATNYSADLRPAPLLGATGAEKGAPPRLRGHVGPQLPRYRPAPAPAGSRAATSSIRGRGAGCFGFTVVLLYLPALLPMFFFNFPSFFFASLLPTFSQPIYPLIFQSFVYF